jgi:hypothetical protein
MEFQLVVLPHFKFEYQSRATTCDKHDTYPDTFHKHATATILCFSPIYTLLSLALPLVDPEDSPPMKFQLGAMPHSKNVGPVNADLAD